MPPASTSPVAGAALDSESRTNMALMAVRARCKARWLQRGVEGGEGVAAPARLPPQM